MVTLSERRAVEPVGNRLIKAVSQSKAERLAERSLADMASEWPELERTRMTDLRPAAVVVLAAGKGTRMKSALPKALHAVGGLSMLGHVISSAATLKPQRLSVVVGHGAEQVEASAATLCEALGEPNRNVALSTPVQEPQLGTGHAVKQALPALSGFEGDVFVLYADTPLIQPETLARMSEARAAGAGVVVLGFNAAVPGAYGRLVTSESGALERIVEAKEADAATLALTLCNSGVMCIDGARLADWIARIDANNAKGEYYLTDLVEIAIADGASAGVVIADEAEVLGVNSRADLAEAEQAFQTRARLRAMVEGATLVAPETVFFAADTRLGRDVIIEPNVVFGGGVEIDDDVVIRAFSHVEGARVERGAVVGPYARLRPGAHLEEGSRVGNFVEVKNATLGRGAKANHLTYLGDASVGEGANIGAGTITCNYDGYLKHRTEIGAGAFIGSNTALVAPVKVGDGAIVAAGSTITESVEADALALGRSRQSVRPGLGARLRESLSDAKCARDAARSAGSDTDKKD